MAVGLCKLFLHFNVILINEYLYQRRDGSLDLYLARVCNFEYAFHSVNLDKHLH